MFNRRLLTTLAATALLTATASLASATELETYDKKLSKAASRIMCMCTGKGLANNVGYLDVTTYEPTPGYVRHKTLCKISGFTTADGLYQGATLCAGFTVVN